MQKKTVRDIEVKNKKVLMRIDFNVPRDKEGNITDDTRIKAALPTIKYLLDNKAKVILVSHLGRPKGQIDEALRLDKVAQRLSELLGQKVIKTDTTVGPEVEKIVEEMNFGEIVLLENVRFNSGETKNDLELAKALASLAEIYVNDAFGTTHRAHSSTAGVANFLPGVAGFLVEKELQVLGRILNNPARPFVAIIGGAKVSDKIGVIENLISKADTIIIGGGMANTFLKAQGYEMGKSLVEEEKVDLAKDLMEKAAQRGVEFLLPLDLVIADGIDNPGKIEIVEVSKLPTDKMALDIGPETIKLYNQGIKDAKTIVWNGPMGVFEKDEFATGTIQIAQGVAKSEAYSLVGGGDSVAAIKKAGLDKEIDHISTGGGASLEFLEGKELPGVSVLLEK
ncbi:MAG: phosphoglycerate kinase [Clostridia bacterium]|jgi:phosphoglycerate kinase|nr:phosphoglycerate kinase [Clostridia bacterium]